MKYGRGHPVLVSLSGDREEVLKKASLIRQYQGWESVFIDPDRTPNERQFHVALREELKKRRNRGETDLIIKNGQIVHRRHVPIEILMSSATSTDTTTSRSQVATETEDQSGRDATSATGNQVPLPTDTQANELNTSQAHEESHVSDNTLVDIQVPEIPRVSGVEEAEDDIQGYLSCTNN